MSLHEDIRYVESLALPDIGPRFESVDAPPPDLGVDQAVVAVGGQLIEFGAAVAPAERSVVSDCLLLAQLAADKAAAMETDPQAWYGQYLAVLQKLGWLQTSMEFKETAVEHDDADMHKAIIPVITALLGPAAAAASMVVAVLTGLQDMDRDNPWITIFDRSSSHARGAKFQLGFVDGGAGDGAIKVRLVAVAIDAERRITQVLFFKFSSEKATLSVAQGEMSAGTDRLQGIRQAVADRVAPFLVDNIAKIDI